MYAMKNTTSGNDKDLIARRQQEAIELDEDYERELEADEWLAQQIFTEMGSPNPRLARAIKNEAWEDIQFSSSEREAWAKATSQEYWRIVSGRDVPTAPADAEPKIMADLIDRELGNDTSAQPVQPVNPEPSPMETFLALNEAAKAAGFKNPYRLGLPYRDDGEEFALDHPIVVKLIADMQAHLEAEGERWNGSYFHIFERGTINRYVLARWDNVHDLNTNSRTSCASARIELPGGIVCLDATDRFLVAELWDTDGNSRVVYVRQL